MTTCSARTMVLVTPPAPGPRRAPRAGADSSGRRRRTTIRAVRRTTNGGPAVEPRYPRSGRRGDDGHRRRESGVLEERRADQRRPGPEVAGLGPGLAALLPDDRRAGLDQVHLPGVPGRYGVAHVRPPPAHPRERGDLGRLLHDLHRPLPLHRPASHGRAPLAGTVELRPPAGLEPEPGGGGRAPGPRAQPGLGSGRAAADQRGRDPPRARAADGAAPDDRSQPAAAGALRVALVPDRRLRVDRREPRP